MKKYIIKIMVLVIIIAFGLVGQDRIMPIGSQTGFVFPEYSQGVIESQPTSWQRPVKPTYKIGPGDVFDISIVSMENVYYQIPVGPSGDIHVPAVGVVNLEGLTLAESKNQIIELIQKKFPKANIEVSLFQTKWLKVTVTGAVDKAGAIHLPGNARLSEVLSEVSPKPTARLYNVTIYREDGTELKVNFQKYYVTGNEDHNPELKLGDQIHLPFGQIGHDIVEVIGDSRVDLVAIEPETTLEFFINSSVPFSGTMYIGQVSVLRNDKTMIINPDNYSEFIIQTGDRIALHRKIPINIIGFVNMPGAYPYFPNFSVQNYIAMAGGLTKQSSMNRVRVIHADGSFSADLQTLIQPGDVIEVRRSFTDILFGEINILSLITTTASVILIWITASN